MQMICVHIKSKIIRASSVAHKHKSLRTTKKSLVLISSSLISRQFLFNVIQLSPVGNFNNFIKELISDF